MICRDKIIFSCLIAAGLGAAGGYIFSSKFCAITIINRVDNALSASQNFINLWGQQAFSTTSLIRSIFFNLPDMNAQAAYFIKNQNAIIEALHSFYGNTLSDSLHPLFEKNKDLLIQLAAQARDKQSFNQTIEELRANNDIIAKMINDANAKNPHISLNEISFLTTQEIIALQTNNWSKVLDYSFQIKNSYEKIAEQINSAIAQQFPQKI